MKNYEILLVDTLSPDTQKNMEQELSSYEASHGVYVNYKKFSLVLKNNAGGIFGVLNAYTAYAEIYIKDLWIMNNYRNMGYGRALLNELYNHFNGQGFNNINLVTSQFQAPEFYKKCGFDVEYVRLNKQNPKFSKTFLVKYFKNEGQFQGVLNVNLFTGAG